MRVPTQNSVQLRPLGRLPRLIVSFVLLGCAFGSPQSYAEGGIGGVLQGGAAIASAISPIVTAGIQASANQAIAGVNAATSVATTRIASDTAKYLSTNQRDVALAQTQAAVNMNSLNQAAVTDRLGMQLAELRDAREQQFALDREKLMIEKELNQARIDLAYKQAEANKRLAEVTLQAELIKNGLSTGFKRRDSGSSLAVTSNLLGGGRSQTAAPPSIASSAPVTTSGNAMADRLLASADSGGSRFPTLREARSATARTASAGALVSSLNRNLNARGSAPGAMARLENSLPQSDLRTFRQSVRAPASEPTSVGRSRTSSLRSTGTHSARGVTGRPVSGKPSERPRL